jgi:hypothetical protein
MCRHAVPDGRSFDCGCRPDVDSVNVTSTRNVSPVMGARYFHVVVVVVVVEDAAAAAAVEARGAVDPREWTTDATPTAPPTAAWAQKLTSSPDGRKKVMAPPSMPSPLDDVAVATVPAVPAADAPRFTMTLSH